MERLEEHARTLAAAQPLTPRAPKGNPLADRLADNEAVLLHAYRTVAKAMGEDRATTPAAEWLIDNYHVVERQIRDIRSDLPPGYYRQLPKLAEGPFAGYPRMLGVAWAFVAHTDSRFDPEILVRYVRAYQEVQPLTIGELWAVAITLRIVLVENLRRLAERIVHSRTSREEADDLADRLLGAGGHTAEPVPVVLAAYEHAQLPDAFAVQLVHRLRDQDPRITPALTWLDQRLAAQGTTADAVVRDEHQRQGAATVTVRNIITSMRMISDVDWTELFERISLVDDVLAGAGAFPEMDFSTRNLYRSAIEELARGSDRTEIEIARRAVLATEQATYADARALWKTAQGDPGYHLLGGGRAAFEAGIGFRPPPHTWLGRASRAIGIGGYVSAVAIVACGYPRLAAVRARRRWAAWGMAEPARWPGCDSRHRRGRRAGEPGRDRQLWRQAPPRFGPARRRALASAHARRGADAADDTRRRSRSRSSGWRSIISPARKATFISHCSPTGSMLRPSTSRATRLSSPLQRRALPSSTSATVPCPAATASCCSIAGESGTKAKDGGSAGSASAVSCTS